MGILAPEPLLSGKESQRSVGGICDSHHRRLAWPLETWAPSGSLMNRDPGRKEVGGGELMTPSQASFALYQPHRRCFPCGVCLGEGTHDS